MNSNIPIYKIIFIGDSSVGKSSLLHRYVDNEFTNAHDMTIGVDFKIKQNSVQNREVNLQLWDTAGQETFRNLVNSYYRNSHCVIMFFDITNKESFEHLDYWYSEIQKHKTKDILTVLIGTKKDLRDDRKVYISDIKNFISGKDIRYFETSSKINEGIYYIFDYITEILLERFDSDKDKDKDRDKIIKQSVVIKKETEADHSDCHKLSTKEKIKKKKCCK